MWIHRATQACSACRSVGRHKLVAPVDLLANTGLQLLYICRPTQACSSCRFCRPTQACNTCNTTDLHRSVARDSRTQTSCNIFTADIQCRFDIINYIYQTIKHIIKTFTGGIFFREKQKTLLINIVCVSYSYCSHVRPYYPTSTKRASFHEVRFTVPKSDTCSLFTRRTDIKWRKQLN